MKKHKQLSKLLKVQIKLRKNIRHKKPNKYEKNTKTTKLK